MVDSNPKTSVITLNTNDLNKPVKDIVKCIKNMIKLQAVYKKLTSNIMTQVG